MILLRLLLMLTQMLMRLREILRRRLSKMMRGSCMCISKRRLLMVLTRSMHILRILTLVERRLTRRMRDFRVLMRPLRRLILRRCVLLKRDACVLGSSLGLIGRRVRLCLVCLAARVRIEKLRLTLRSFSPLIGRSCRHCLRLRTLCMWNK